MNVYVLLEERDQPEFVDNYGEEAVPSTTILGVYKDKDRADKEAERLTTENLKNEEELETDPVYYYVEERPVL